MAAALVALAAVAAYASSLSVPFFFDDRPAIVDNPTIRQLAAIGQVLSPPNDGSSAMGRPIVNLSLAINHAIGGTEPRGYHVLNVILHGLSGLVLLGVVRRTLLQPVLRERWAAGSALTACAVAVWWVAHPLQTESVSCVVQRTELLVGLFYVLTLYGFVRYAENPDGRRWAAISITACALGMASKEVMVTAPVIVLLYDRTFVAGSFREAWKQRRWLHASLGATWLILAILAMRSGGGRAASAGFGLGITPWSYLLKQFEAIVTYVQLALWPNPLVIDYGTAVAHDWAEVALQALAVAIAGGATLWALVRRPVWGFLGAWFFAILAPSSSFVPLVSQTMAEHRMYLPLAAIVAVLAGVGHALIGARTLAVMATAASALGITTVARNHMLQDELALWSDTMAKRPENPRAHASYALALSDRDRYHEAIPHFERALALDPKSVATHQNLANAFVQVGSFPAAIAHYRRAIQLEPSLAIAHNSLGVALRKSGDMESALREFQRAVQLDPKLASAHQNLARALFDLGRFAEAGTYFARVLELKPSARAHYDLGLALARDGKLDGAVRHFDEALRQRPNPIEYHNYGLFLLSAGRPAEAAAQFERALKLKPDYREARENFERARAAVNKTP
jgi:protein O-mannosyl-transferase